VHVSAASPLAFAAQAMDNNRKGHTRGKIVVVM
jgi:hypothetical protein